MRDAAATGSGDTIVLNIDGISTQWGDPFFIEFSAVLFGASKPRRSVKRIQAKEKRPGVSGTLRKPAPEYGLLGCTNPPRRII